MRKIKYMLMVIGMFLISMPVYAAKKSSDVAACSKYFAVDNKIASAVHTIVVIMWIAVPILLVIFGSIDLIKAIVAGKEDEIKKYQSTFLRRLIMGVLVFFVIAIVKLIFSFANSDNKTESSNMWKCANAFINGSD